LWYNKGTNGTEMKSKINKIILVVIVLLLVAGPVSAAFVFCGRSPGEGVPVEQTEPCEISHLWILVFRMVNYLIGMSGLVSLAFIVWGGVRMMLSAGNPAAIQEGKATIWHALLGLVIVLLSYLIVGYVAELLLPGGSSGDPLRNLLDFIIDT
jgi:ABC-type Fe3+ transport system permease subunit